MFPCSHEATAEEDVMALYASRSKIARSQLRRARLDRPFGLVDTDPRAIKRRKVAR